MAGGSPNLYSFADADSLSSQLRKYVLQSQNTALTRHSSFRVAVSGGSLPSILAKALLAPSDGEDDTPDFSRWEIFFADERVVPLDHKDSNYALLKSELLDKIPTEQLGQPRVHTIELDDDTQEVADKYQEALTRVFAAKDSVKIPVFDLILLGCGPDGHTCSLFPGHELLREHDSWVAPIEDSPKPPPKRITFTFPVITHGLRIAFVATGAGKQDILRQIFDEAGGAALPCAMVNAKAGDKLPSPTKRSHPLPANPKNIPRRSTTSVIAVGVAVGSCEGIENGVPDRKSFLPQRRPTTSQRPKSIHIQPSRQTLNAPQKSGIQLDIASKPEVSERQHTHPGSSQPVSTVPSAEARPKPEPREPTKVANLTRLARSASLRQPLGRTSPIKSRPDPPVPTETVRSTRLGRSASLRQPVFSKPKPSTTHSRHRSQVVNPDIAKAGLLETKPVSNHPTAIKPGKPQQPTRLQRFGLQKFSKTDKNTSPPILENSEKEEQVSPQTLALQTELLQLHVLHAQGVQANEKWEANARKYYQKLHQSVAASYRRDQDKHRFRNIQALKKLEEKSNWSQSGHNFAAQIGTLSRIIQDTTELTQLQDSPLNRVTKEFDEWTTHVTQVKLSREAEIGSNTESCLQFIEPLSQQWKDDTAALARELSQLSILLDQVDIPKKEEVERDEADDYSDSAVVRAVTGHKQLLDSMVEELDTIFQTEIDIMELEIAWMEQALENVDE
ncbi:suppressor of los1-1 [Myotisia sp. PD_48]|nr:suppressor of los1-1 [Myotisia sp. PD_48]